MRRFSPFATLTNVALIGISLFGCHSDIEPISISADCLIKASTTNGVAIAGSYIVTYKPAQSLSSAPNARMAATEALAEQFLADYQVADSQAEVLATGNETSFLAHLTESESEKLKQDSSVLLVEPDRIMSMCNCVDVATSSTLYWNIKQTGYGRGDLQTTKTAWIIDTGIDLDHPDLNVDATRSKSFVSGQTSADDENGHGTHIAGIIGAKNNSIGVTGIASGATLVALRVLDDEAKAGCRALFRR